MIIKYLLTPTNTKILIFLIDNNASNYTHINKKLDVTFSAVVKSINKLRELKLTELEHTGRITKVNLTSKGVMIANHLKEIYEAIK